MSWRRASKWLSWIAGLAGVILFGWLFRDKPKVG